MTLSYLGLLFVVVVLISYLLNKRKHKTLESKAVQALDELKTSSPPSPKVQPKKSPLPPPKKRHIPKFDPLKQVDLTPFQTAGLLDEETIAACLEKRKDLLGFHSFLRQSAISPELQQKYNRELYRGISTHRYLSINEVTEFDEARVTEIKTDLNTHLSLLHQSGIVAEKIFHKLREYIEAGHVFTLHELYSCAFQYNQNAVHYHQTDYQDFVEKGVLAKLPDTSSLFTDFDLAPYFKIHRQFTIEDYDPEKELDRIRLFLQEVAALLPDGDRISDLKVSIEEDGRDIYNRIVPDLKISFLDEGQAFEYRSRRFLKPNPVTEIAKLRTYQNYRFALEVFNKWSMERESTVRVLLCVEQPPNRQIQNRIAVQNAIVVIAQDLKGLPLVSTLRGIESGSWFVKASETQSYVEHLKAYQILDRYEDSFIEHISQISQAYHLIDREDFFWFFDYLIAPIVPRESSSYEEILNYLSKISGGEVTISDILTIEEEGPRKISFLVNGEKFVSGRIGNDFDISFLPELNDFLQEQELGNFYAWNWSRTPWEQLCVIYLPVDVFINYKNHLKRHFTFMDMEKEMLEIYKR